MIPMTATVRVQKAGNREWKFWVPLFLAWVLALPLAIIALPFFLIACLIGWINPFRAMGVFFGIFSALAGTEFDLEKDGHTVKVRLN